jgi:hypothetical protein
MTQSRILPLLLLLAALAFAGMPFVTSFSGFEPDLYPVPQDDPPAQPAGYAFSIWGIIYLWLIVSTGFGLWKRADDRDWAATRPALLVSLIIGVAWLPVAEVSPVWATILIWAMLISALYALLRTPKRDLWLLRAPVGLYAGWLTAASSVSIALVGAGYDLLPLSQTAWAILAILIGLSVSLAMLMSRSPLLAYGAAVVWALIAIVVKNGTDVASVSALAAFGVVVVAGLALFRGRQA